MVSERSRQNLMIRTLSAVIAGAALLLCLMILVLRARSAAWTVILLWGSILSLGSFMAVVLWYLLELTRLQKGAVNSGKTLRLIRTLLHELYPALFWLTGFFKIDKDALGIAYIQTNNHIIQKLVDKVPAGKVLILLPHCLQWSECPHKVAGDGARCVACGKCLIGDLKEMAREMNLPLVIATGGTLARKAIAENRPELIIAVACERDLAAGIYDMRKLPVIGLLNERPEGPCKNTLVDIAALKELLARFVQSPKNNTGNSECS